MAKVYAKNVGGSTVELEVTSIQDVRDALNNQKATATVNGRPADASYIPKDGDFIVLSENTKGNADGVYKNKELTLVVVYDRSKKVFIVNGQEVTKGQAIKMAKAILELDGYVVD